jgi:hypothetical protein
MGRILYSLTVIELSAPGQSVDIFPPHSSMDHLTVGLEATTYELVASVSNAAMSLSSILATQLLSVVHATGCTEDDDDDGEGSGDDPMAQNSTSTSCSSDSVDLSSVDSFEDSHGPARFTRYTLLLSMPSLSYLFCLILFLSQLPSPSSRCSSSLHSSRRTESNVTSGLCKGSSPPIAQSVHWFSPPAVSSWFSMSSSLLVFCSVLPPLA